DSNNVSLQNVIEQITILADPQPDAVLPIELDIMTLWARTDLDTPVRGHARVTFLSPSGLVSDGPLEFDVDLSKHNRHRCRGRFQGLHISEPGRHAFLVELQQNEDGTEWHQVAAIPLEVNFVPPEEVEQTETVL
ncbi:MAG: hypothetical protein V3S14_03355, partial [Anaerolineae bacterium]